MRTVQGRLHKAHELRPSIVQSSRWNQSKHQQHPSCVLFSWKYTEDPRAGQSCTYTRRDSYANQGAVRVLQRSANELCCDNCTQHAHSDEAVGTLLQNLTTLVFICSRLL
jgi:hypothetical protein